MSSILDRLNNVDSNKIDKSIIKSNNFLDKLDHNRKLPSTSNLTSSLGVEVSTNQLDPEEFSKYLTPTGDKDNVEIRAENQSTGEKWKNGTIRMLGVAATTAIEPFLDATYGLAASIVNEDHRLGSELDTVNKKITDAFPIYYTQAEQNMSLLREMGTANFWADKAFNGLGFTLGAVASGWMTAGLADRALGIKTIKNISKLAEEGKDLHFATEGAEAITDINKGAKGVNYKTGIKYGLTNFAAAHTEARMEGTQIRDDSRSLLIKNRLEELGLEDESQLSDKDIEKIEQLSESAGNIGYVFNLGLVGGEHMIQFPKWFMPGYEGEKRAFNKVVKKGIGEFEAETGKGLSKVLKVGAKALQVPFAEGTQEQLQYVLEQGLPEYSAKQYKDNSDTLGNFITGISDGFQKAYGTKEGWENFLLGAILGVNGIYNTIKNERIDDKHAHIVAENLKKWSLQDKFQDHINGYLESIDSRENRDEALKNNDRFYYENEKARDFINLVKTHIEAGKFDDLVQDFDSIKGFDETEFKKFFGYEEGQPLPKGIHEVIDNLKKKAIEINDIHQSIETRYGSSLSKELRNRLFNSASVISNIDNREKILGDEIAKITGDASLVKDYSNVVRNVFREPTANKIMQELADKDKLSQEGKIEYDKIRKEEKDNYRKVFEDKINEFKNKNPLKADEVQEKLDDIIKLQDKREDFIKLYNTLSNSETAKVEQGKIDKENERIKGEKEKGVVDATKKDIDNVIASKNDENNKKKELDRLEKLIKKSALTNDNKKILQDYLDTAKIKNKASENKKSKEATQIKPISDILPPIIENVSDEITQKLEDLIKTSNADENSVITNVPIDNQLSKINNVNPQLTSDEYDKDEDIEKRGFKKSNIFTLAWRDIKSKIINEFGKQEDVKVEGVSQEEVIDADKRDLRIRDYKQLPVGTELEFVIDYDKASELGIDVSNPKNIHNIPIGIKEKGKDKIIAMLHILSDPNELDKEGKGKLDENIDNILSNDPNVNKRLQQLKLVALREYLYNQLIAGNRVESKITDKSIGQLNTVENEDGTPKYGRTIDRIGNSLEVGEDIVFGFTNSNKGTNYVILNKENNSSKGTFLPSFSIDDDFSDGRLFVAIPSAAQNIEKENRLVEIYLKIDSIADSSIDDTNKNDADIIYEIMLDDKGNISKQLDKLGINHLRQRVDLLRQFIRVDKLNGIDIRGDKIFYRNTFIADLSNRDTLLNFIKENLKYNIAKNNIKGYLDFKDAYDESKPIGERLDLSKNKELISIDKWIATHSTTHIMGRHIIDENGESTDRMQFFNQPTVHFENPLEIKLTERPIIKRKGIPLQITKDTRQQLLDLGYSKEDISQMTPETALTIVESESTKPKERIEFKEKDTDIKENGLNINNLDDEEDNLEVQLSKETFDNKDFSNISTDYKNVIQLAYDYLDKGGKEILVRLNTVLRNKGIEFKLESIDSNIVATIKGKIITLNPIAISKSNRSIGEIITHELVHGATVEAINNPKTEKEILFSKKVKELYEYSKKRLLGGYQFKNEKEFVAEAFANSEFREELRDLEYKGDNLLQRFWNYIKELFGFKNDSVFNVLNRYSNDILEESRISSIESNLEDPSIIKGLTDLEVSHIVSAMNTMAQNYKKKDSSRSYSNIYNKIYNDLVGYYTQYSNTLDLSKESNKAVIERYKTILQEDVYQRLVNKSNNDVSKLSRTILEDDNENDIKGEIGERYDRQASEKNSKDKASIRLKRFLSYLPNQVERNGVLKDVPNLFRLPTNLKYDTVYNSLANVLVGKRMNEMLNYLKELGEYNPTFKTISNELEKYSISNDKDEVQIVSEFLTNFFNQKGKYLTIQFKNSEYKGQFRVEINVDNKVIFSNRKEADDIILQDWHSNFINEDISKTIFKDVNDAITNKNNKEIQKLLNNIGITLSDRAIDLIEKNPKLIDFNFNINKDFYEPIKHIIKRVSDRVKEKKSEEYEIVANVNPFVEGNERGRLKQLAKIELLVSNNIFNSMFRNEMGNNVYTIHDNSLLSNIVRDIRDTNSFRFRNYLKSSYHRNSYWISKMLVDNEFRNNFDIQYVNAFNETGNYGNGKSYRELTYQEREVAKLILYMNSGEKIGRFISPTNSDSSSIFTISTERVNVKMTDGKLNKEAIDALYTIFLSEHSRIETVQSAIDKYKGSNNKKLIKNYHYTLNKDGSRSYVNARGLQFHLFNFLNNLVYDNKRIEEISHKDINNLPELKELVEGKINDFIQSSIQDKLNNWEKLGVTIKGKLDYRFLDDNAKIKLKIKNDEKGVRDFATEFVTNCIISNANYTQIFANDVAFAKDTKDAQKRNKIIGSTGIEYNLQGDMNTLMTNDIKVHNKFYTNLKDNLEQQLKRRNINLGIKDNSKEEAERIMEGHKNITTTDSQAYYTLDEYEKQLSGLGRLTTNIRGIINKARNGKTVDISEIVDVLGAQKPVYGEDIWNEELGLLKRVYLKFSVFPLFPQLTKNYKDLDNFRLKLEKSKVGMVIFDSGVKLGSSNLHNIYKDETQNELNEINEDNIQYLPYTGLRLQQEIPYDKDKEEINDGTQKRKLLTGDLLDKALGDITFNIGGKEVSARTLNNFYNDLYRANVEEEFQNFARDFGLEMIEEKSLNEENIEETNYRYKVTNLMKVNELLKSFAKNMNFSDNSMSALQLKENEFGELSFNVPLFFTPNSHQFESLLSSIITKEIVRQKVQGNTFTQGSNMGFNMVGKIKTIEELPQDQIDKIQWIQNKKGSLDSLRLEDNKIQAEGVLLPNVYAKYNIRNLQDLINEGLFDIFSFRIPTGGHNFMSNLRVEGFLPIESGNLIIINPSMIVRSGSDMDADKQFVNFYNIEEVTPQSGTYRKVQYDYNKLPIENSREARENAILDLTKEVMSKKELLENIITPDNEELLEESAKDLKSLRPKTEIEDNILLDSTQDKVFDSNAVGKEGIKIAAIWNTFHAQSQYTSLKRRVYEEDENKEKTIVNEGVKILNEKGTLITDDYNNTFKGKVGLFTLNKIRGFKKNLISRVIKTILSATVDNPKNQNLSPNGLNEETLSTAIYLAKSGIDDLKIITSFLNQESILKVVDFKKRLSSVFIKYEEGTLFNRAIKKSIQYYTEKIGDNFKFDVDADGDNLNLVGVSHETLRNDYKLSQLSKEDFDNLDDSEKKDFYKRQLERIKEFANYYNDAKMLGNVVSAYNVDNGLGKNYFSIKDKYEKLKSLNNSGRFIGTRDLMKGTFVEALYNRAFKVGNDIFTSNNLYPFGGSFYVNSSSFIGGILKNLNEETNKRVNSGMITFLTSLSDNGLYNSNKDIDTERKRLLVSSKDNKSLAERILEFKLTEEGKLNYTIQRLQTIFDKQELKKQFKKGYDRIEYNRGQVEKSEEELVTRGIIALLNSSNPETVKIGEDIIKYTYLTNASQSTSGLNTVIPVNYLIEQKFGDYYNSSKYNDLSNDIALSYRFAKQFAQNNIDLVRGVKDSDKYTKEGNIIKGKDFLGNFVKLRNRSTDFKDELYEYGNVNDKGENVYYKIGFLGDNFLHEYNANKDDVLSMLPKNNITVRLVKQGLTNMEETVKKINVISESKKGDSPIEEEGDSLDELIDKKTKLKSVDLTQEQIDNMTPDELNDFFKNCPF